MKGLRTWGGGVIFSDIKGTGFFFSSMHVERSRYWFLNKVIAEVERL